MLLLNTLVRIKTQALMARRARPLLVIAGCLLFCSCQALPTATKSAVQQEPAPLNVLPDAAGAAAQAVRPLPVPNRPQPTRPIITAANYPPAPPHTVRTVPAPPPQHQHQHGGGTCPCCGPKGKFKFSDAPGLPTAYAPGSAANPYGAAPAAYQAGGCESGACGFADCQGGGCPSGACNDGACAYPPYDEYICDGGDNYRNATVRNDWSVQGLDQEDTIVHFDTVDGRTEHSVSNKVCLYAPRFAAVRQITGLESSEQADRLADAKKALPPVVGEELKIVSDLNQPQQPVADLGVKGSQSFLERQRGLTSETTRHLALAHLDLLPYENLEMIRRGMMQNNEKLRLAQVAANAIVWTGDQAVQVVLDKKQPLEAVRDTSVGETVLYDRQGQPRMRIIKIADKSEAQPGDIVSFTLRFDNVGEQKVGNVTILDNLTTRLEYVEGSQECSHKANFVTTPNDGETFILKWEIEDPMRVGEGGIIHFKCRVR